MSKGSWKGRGGAVDTEALFGVIQGPVFFEVILDIRGLSSDSGLNVGLRELMDNLQGAKVMLDACMGMVSHVRRERNCLLIKGNFDRDVKLKLNSQEV